MSKKKEQEYVTFNITTDEAAGMFAVAYFAARYLPEQFKSKGTAGHEIIKQYGSLISGLVFQELFRIYGKGESLEWDDIHEKTTNLTSLLVDIFEEVKYEPDTGAKA